jgi:hypothetical protein
VGGSDDARAAADDARAAADDARAAADEVGLQSSRLLSQMEPDRKRQKPSERVIEINRRWVEKWREEHEATANLWLVVTYPVEGGEQFRIPTRREFISYYSGLVRGAPDPTDDEADDEFPLIGDFLPWIVVEFARSCLPSPTGLQSYAQHGFCIYCRFVLLSHYMDAPILMNHWLKELQQLKRDLGSASDFQLVFALRDKGLIYDMSEGSLENFTFAYQEFDETEKIIYHKHAQQIFSENYELRKKNLEKVGKESDAWQEEGDECPRDDCEKLYEHMSKGYETMENLEATGVGLLELVEALLAMPRPAAPPPHA